MSKCNTIQLVQQDPTWAQMLQRIYPKDNFLRLNGIPIFTRKGKYGAVAMSQPGYAGYAPVTQASFTELFDALKGMGVDVYTYVSPPLFSALMDMSLVRSFDWVKTNPVQYLDLTKPLLYRKDIQRKLKKVLGLGKKLDVRTFYTAGPEFEEWYGIHLKRCSEQQATPLAKEFMQECLAHPRVHLTCVYYLNYMIGGSLFLQNHDHVDYFRSAFDSDYFYLDGTTLMLNHEIEAAKLEGIPIFNMQSSKRVGDGTWLYKAGFGCAETEHYYLTKKIGHPEHIQDTPITELRREYDGYYIMPYTVLRGGE